MDFLFDFKEGNIIKKKYLMIDLVILMYSKLKLLKYVSKFEATWLQCLKKKNVSL